LAEGEPRAQAAIDQADKVLAPALFAAEVANALWKYVRAGQLDTETVLSKLRLALAIPDKLERLTETRAAAALAEAASADHPVYDMLYICLAERKGAALATADRRLAALAEERGIEVVPA
jgi:predicted nucleic acid-binding protein